MRSWGWDHHGPPGGGREDDTGSVPGRDTGLLSASSVSIEDMRTGRRGRTEASFLDINTILFVRNKLLLQSERLCKI